MSKGLVSEAVWKLCRGVPLWAPGRIVKPIFQNIERDARTGAHGGTPLQSFHIVSLKCPPGTQEETHAIVSMRGFQ